MLGRLRRYLAELAFAMRVCVTWRGFVRLTTETLLFHLGNLLRRRGLVSTPFAVQIKLNNIATTVWLRRYAGDIFVFYEVLKDEAYRLPLVEKHAADNVREVFDCGGNIGLTALYFADRYQNARVLSIEPLPANFELLKRNAAGIQRIEPIWGCVSDTRGQRFLSVDRPAWGNTVVNDPSGCAVPAYTINCLRDKYEVELIDLLKVDIEGEERRVFADASFLSWTRLVLVELHGNYSASQFQDDVGRYGYVVRMPDPTEGLHVITAVPGKGRCGLASAD